MSEMMGPNEERVVRFIEKEMTPAEERALLDECSSSDEMRSLLKQHVLLSKRLSSTLAAVAVPIAATEKLNERLAEMRGNTTTGARSGRRGFALSAMVGAALLFVGGVTYYVSQNSVQVPENKGGAPSSIVAQLPPVPSITQQDNVSSASVTVDLSTQKSAVTHHRLPFQAMEKKVAAPPSVAQNMKTDSVTVAKTKQQRIENLTGKDIVK
ncbi:MAG TPA: hypothetical protein VFJ29_00905 [Candidatus Kapabacteria bacterium]|nr:hypothetical protein [Candidatus Kapabacteria bacterium]